LEVVEVGMLLGDLVIDLVGYGNAGDERRAT